MAKTKIKAQPVVQTDDDTLYYERCAGIDVHKNVLSWSFVCETSDNPKHGSLEQQQQKYVNWSRGSNRKIAVWSQWRVPAHTGNRFTTF